MYKNVSLIDKADYEHSNLFKELSNINKGEKPVKKIFILENVRVLLEVREIVLNSFKSNLFPLEEITPDPTPDLTTDLPVFYTPKQTREQSSISKIKISPFKLSENFIDEIRDEEKYINNEIFKAYFEYQNPLFLVKDLLKANQVKNNQVENQASYSINETRRNAVIRKEIPENENPSKIISIVEKIINFNN